MGQVPMALQTTSKSSPSKILIVGNGRVANAFKAYIQTQIKTLLQTQRTAQNGLKMPVPGEILHLAQWHRQLEVKFSDCCGSKAPTHVWIAITDDAICKFIEENFTSLVGKTVCHFSGGKPSLTVTKGEQSLTVHATHPLTTFGNITDPSWIRNFAHIPFVLDRSSVTANFKLESLLPGMDNPIYAIDASDRPYYHALCALAGGLTVMTWEAIQARFQSNLNLDPNVLQLFRKQIFENLSAGGEASVLTGPVARGDLKMIATHFGALEAESDATLMQMYSLLRQLNRLEAARK